MGLKVIMSPTWWAFFCVCLSCVSACPCKRCLCNPILLMEMDCWRISNLSIPFSNSYAHKQVGPALTQLSLLPSVVKQEPWSLPKVGKQPPVQRAQNHTFTYVTQSRGQQAEPTGQHPVWPIREIGRDVCFPWLLYKRESSCWATALEGPSSGQFSLVPSEPCFAGFLAGKWQTRSP